MKKSLFEPLRKSYLGVYFNSFNTVQAQNMPDHLKKIKLPSFLEPNSILTVDRCVSELRRGQMAVISDSKGISAVVQAAEAITDQSLLKMHEITKSKPKLAITSRRAMALNLSKDVAPAIILRNTIDWKAQNILDIINPLLELNLRKKDYNFLNSKKSKKHSCETASIKLAKIARLLPATIFSRLTTSFTEDLGAWSMRHNLLTVDAGDIFQYEHTQAQNLKAVSEAQVPLLHAQDTRIIAFRPKDGGLEHLAILINEDNLEKDQPILARLHSECFTGDLLASLKCDCGDQLRGAINEISNSGGGVLLYLAQEGRGIGLVNKLRAYKLQDSGFDTIDANEQLGFDADERIYLPAAEILHQLGFKSIRLMTNNPEKIKSLASCGINIIERVKHAFPSNKHNEQYLKTKAKRIGHLI